MSTPDFSTAENNQELANEVSCLKAMLRNKVKCNFRILTNLTKRRC